MYRQLNESHSPHPYSESQRKTLYASISPRMRSPSTRTSSDAIIMSSDGSRTTNSSRFSQFGLYRTIDARTEEFLRLSRKRQIRQGCACAAVSTAITVTVVIVSIFVVFVLDFCDMCFW